MFAELHCISNFTFLRGASHPEELVERAAELGYRALALTDECSLAGVVRAYRAAKAHHLKLIIGTELQLDGMTLVLLARNRQGYGQLGRLISQARRRSPKGDYRLQRQDLQQGLEDCLALWVAEPEQPDTECQWLQRCFPGRLWLALNRSFRGDDRRRYQTLCEQAQRHGLPVLATASALMHRADRLPLQHVLTAIRLGLTVPQAGTALAVNSEQRLLSLPRLQRRFTPQQLQETLKVADLCRFDLGSLRYEYPQELVPPGDSATSRLRQRVSEGAQNRFPEGPPAAISRQIDHELTLIDELGYQHFFLTIDDIVRFARARGILCQGRGSAANSVVCYCLGITEVDPQQVNLLFERFLSRERHEPPDIDVDFEHERREEVIQYLYRKYGRERAALTATVIRYRPKSAIRDVGRAMGLDPYRLEGLLQQLDWRDHSRSSATQLRHSALANSPSGVQFISLVEQILGFPRHLSQHVGGFVISAGPLTDLVPVENTAMPERTVIQWDKDDLATLGLLKVDLLALGMLTAIRKAFDAHQHITGQRLALADLPREDAAVYDMLSQGDSIGVFQVESRAQIAMLPRLQPRCYYDLVIEVAIVRPGPIQGDMVHPYLRRRHGQEPVDYPSAAVEAILAPTLGVPIFQEQVIKLAMVAAGFSAGEADQLRRAMASWKRHGQLQQFEDKLIRGMLANGHSEAFARRLFQQIRGFGEYGFPESHAASFALLVYASAWLKRHHPAAFYCGLLNSQPMGFYSPSQLLQDARRHQVTIRPVDINHSHWAHRLEPDGHHRPALRLGLQQVKGLARQPLEALLRQRPPQGFADLQPLIRQLDQGQLEALASAGALQSLAGHRHQARWEMAGADSGTAMLPADSLQEPPVTLPAPDEMRTLVEDYAALGLTLGRHPLALLRQRQPLRRALTAVQLRQQRHGQPVTVAGLVVGRQRPSTASGVTFVTLEDETGNVNLVVWEATARQQQQALLRARLLVVRGILERQEQVIHVIAGQLQDASALLSQLRVPSRDFH